MQEPVVEFKQYFYVVVRKDLSMADQICQVAHAAAGAGRKFGIPDGCNLVLLQVANALKLYALADKLGDNGIQLFREIDPDKDQDGRVLDFTAFATRVIVDESERRLLRKSQLWREPHVT